MNKSPKEYFSEFYFIINILLCVLDHVYTSDVSGLNMSFMKNGECMRQRHHKRKH